MRQVCIHGHFYQPPREDPWLGSILSEASAAPERLWNERILKESYLPLAYARRVDADGKIVNIINCYEWISFNFGPTLMKWIDRRSSDLSKKLIEADQKSFERFGHGNAIAQIYHHIIMPLASELDKELEVAWSIADFEKRYNRKPEGMWLSECAVDIASLEVLAKYDINFTILAPRQAKAISSLSSDSWEYIHEQNLDIRFPYFVELPSGKSIAVFFYNGPISQAVAFEQLLKNGENYWQRLNQASGEGLLAVSTDGETYGHHFKFGEMALAYVIEQCVNNRDGVELSNYASFLAKNPPKFKVLLHEPSSWSCVHGIERWRSDCGCTDGGHTGWNQKWRTPLRSCLEKVKAKLDYFYFEYGKNIFKDPKEALINYGKVLAKPEYATEYFEGCLKDKKDAGKAEILLTMQEQGLASLASCAWFFDDISRLEPLNALTYALHATDLLKKLGGEDLTSLIEHELAYAQSNKPEVGSGLELFNAKILPRRENMASICLQALSALMLMRKIPQDDYSEALSDKVPVTMSWPYVSVELLEFIRKTEKSAEGKVRVRFYNEEKGQELAFYWEFPLDPNYGNHNVYKKIILNQSDISLLFQSFIKVVRENGVEETTGFKDLAKHKIQALTLIMLSNMAKNNKEYLLPVALNLVSVFDSFEEAQYDQPCSELWSEIICYIPLALVVSDDMTQERRKEIIKYVKSFSLNEIVLKRIKNIIEFAVLEVLGFEADEVLKFGIKTNKIANNQKIEENSIKIAEKYIERANSLELGITWWTLQNKIYNLGNKKTEFSGIAEKIGFK